MRLTLVFLALVGLCYCTVEGASPTWGAPGLPSGPDDVSTVTTVPTIAGVSPVASSAALGASATPAPTATRSPSVRTTTVRTTGTKRVTTAPTTAAPSARRTSPTPTRVPTAERTVPPATWAPAATVAPTVLIGTNFTPTWPTDQAPVTAPAWTQPVGTTAGPATGTPDIDPGMTPYSGPTEFVTVEPTPTWAAPAFGANATPTEPPTTIPFFTTEAVGPPIELPPGAYDEWIGPATTETSVPLPLEGPADGLSSSLLPRWLGYLLFIFLGVSGVAGLALIGSYLGRRPPVMDGPPSAAPVRSRPPSPYPRGPRLLQPGSDETTADAQILADRIQGATPESMHVERLGSLLLALEDAARTPDRSPRLSQLIVFSSIPSAPVPDHAAAWAGQHGFRIIAIDGSGMALVMPALSSGERTLLGVLSVREMVEGASLAPMPIVAAPRGRPEVARTG